MYDTGRVEMRVQENGEDTLVYSFAGVTEASEMLAFLKDFFPGARFVIEPQRH
ncbi:MAG: hypothetical protein AAF771_03065 [Pseudomonadota bacterium]